MRVSPTTTGVVDQFFSRDRQRDALDLGEVFNIARGEANLAALDQLFDRRARGRADVGDGVTVVGHFDRLAAGRAPQNLPTAIAHLPVGHTLHVAQCSALRDWGQAASLKVSSLSR